MSKESGTKINRLLREWPAGTVATTGWLADRGIDSNLLVRYRMGNWVESIGRGAVCRKGDRIEWPGAVYAVQRHLRLAIHPGGRTALELLGLAHSLPMRQPRVSLFGAEHVRLPAWFRARNWGARIDYYMTGLFPPGDTTGTVERSMGAFSIRLSAPERAIMEALYLVPRAIEVEEAVYLMEGLTTLRPAVVQRLLLACTSVKVKRLFMALAEDAGHAWVGRLTPDAVDFGVGKRVVARGGRLHPKYLVTVP